MAFALDTQSLDLIAARVAELAPATAIEFGSGKSTLVLAEHATKVISLEQDPYWADQTRQMVDDAGFTNVEIRVAAAKDGSYDAVIKARSRFLLIDGPRIRDGRARTVEHLWPQVSPGGELWVDDLHRPEVAGWLRRWESVAGPVEPLTLRLGRFVRPA